MKIKVLRLLETSKKANSKISIDRIEKLINLNSSDRLIGGEFISFLEKLKKEELITSDENGSYYSITSKGLDYLKNH